MGLSRLLILMEMCKAYIKKYKKLILTVAFVTLFALLIIYDNILLYILGTIIVILLWLNRYIYNATAYNAKHMFSTVGRNYKRLVIGEMCDEKKTFGQNGETICFLSPAKRSPQMIFELIKRLYSLLDEKSGELFIVQHRSSEKNDKISVFDIPYLHEITLRSFGITYMKWTSRFPLFVEPLASFRFLLNCSSHIALIEDICPYNKIVTFCKDRNINVRFFYIQS